MTRRHFIAAYLCEEAAKNDLSIELVENAGSEDCLTQLRSGRLDVALVSSCVVLPDDDNIMVLGALELEPVHVLVRKGMAQSGSFNEMVHGKRVQSVREG